jgi:hypothetical protein
MSEADHSMAGGIWYRQELGEQTLLEPGYNMVEGTAKEEQCKGYIMVEGCN